MLAIMNNIRTLHTLVDLHNIGVRRGYFEQTHNKIKRVNIVLDEFSAYAAYTVAAIVGCGVEQYVTFLTYRKGKYFKMSLI